MWNGPPDGTVPDFEAARDHVLNELIRFARTLRYHHVAVPANAAINAAEAMVLVGFEDKDQVHTALRAVFVSREEDLPVFDRLFPVFWQRLQGKTDTSDVDEAGVMSEEDAREMFEESLGIPEDVTDTDRGSLDNETRNRSFDDHGASVDREETDGFGADDTVTTAVYSPAGRSTEISVTEDGLHRDTTLESRVRELTRVIAALPGRRWGTTGSDRVDTRRALRESFGTGGTVVSVPRKSRQLSGVQATVFVDVSQSVLDTIDRGFLLDFLRAVHQEWRQVRIFFFDTQVREVTDAFAESTPQAALAELRAVETEWGGGTRIGNAITTVRNENPDAVGRDSIVFVISDGLEVGEIDVLESGLAWVAKRSSAVLWLNPLASSPKYEPTCRGMAAALPYINGLFSFSDVSDITELTRQLEQHGLNGTIGYEYDPRRAQVPD